MSGLNPQQREAIHYLDGPLLVLAGAGSGKTRVITQKIAYLVQDCGFQPRNVAAITFTNKAAKEMKERISKLLPRHQADDLQISTFHSLGVRILREEAKALGYKPRFSIFDSADCAGIIGEVAKTVDKATLRQTQSIISNWKNALISPEAARQIASTEHEALAAHAYLSYEATLKAYQAVDFDDLIGLPVTLFQQHPEITDKWQNRLRYLLVDEYQDTNAGQYQLLKLLTGVRAQFTAVGDDDQAIYGWRGADIENLKKLPTEFPALKVIKLEQNYRSTVRILKAANNVISHNEKLFDKKLWSELGHGEQVTVTTCRDNDAEAEGVGRIGGVEMGIPPQHMLGIGGQSYQVRILRGRRTGQCVAARQHGQRTAKCPKLGPPHRTHRMVTRSGRLLSPPVWFVLTHSGVPANSIVATRPAISRNSASTSISARIRPRQWCAP